MPLRVPDKKRCSRRLLGELVPCGKVSVRARRHTVDDSSARLELQQRRGRRLRLEPELELREEIRLAGREGLRRELVLALPDESRFTGALMARIGCRGLGEMR